MYVEEAHSKKVREWADESEIIATCRVAYPEMISALTRRFKTGDFSQGDYVELINIFSGDWDHLAVIDFDELEAGDLVGKYGLRGFDAVHLSALKIVKRKNSNASLLFSSFDLKLNEAAASEGIPVAQI